VGIVACNRILETGDYSVFRLGHDGFCFRAPVGEFEIITDSLVDVLMQGSYAAQRRRWRDLPHGFRSDFLAEHILGSRMKVPQLCAKTHPVGGETVSLPGTKEVITNREVSALVGALTEHGYFDIAFVLCVQHLTGMYAEEVIGHIPFWDAGSYDGSAKFTGTRMADPVFDGFPSKGNLKWLVARYWDAPWRLVQVTIPNSSVLGRIWERWTALGGWRCDSSVPMALCTLERYRKVMWHDAVGNGVWYEAGCWFSHYNNVGRAKRDQRIEMSLAPVQPVDANPNQCVKAPVDISELEAHGLVAEVCEGIVFIPDTRGNYQPLGYAPRGTKQTVASWNQIAPKVGRTPATMWGPKMRDQLLVGGDEHVKQVTTNAWDQGRRLRLSGGV